MTRVKHKWLLVKITIGNELFIRNLSNLKPTSIKLCSIENALKAQFEFLFGNNGLFTLYNCFKIKYYSQDQHIIVIKTNYSAIDQILCGLILLNKIEEISVVLSILHVSSTLRSMTAKIKKLHNHNLENFDHDCLL